MGVTHACSMKRVMSFVSMYEIKCYLIHLYVTDGHL